MCIVRGGEGADIYEMVRQSVRELFGMKSTTEWSGYLHETHLSRNPKRKG